MFSIGAKYKKKLTDKKQSLDRHANESKKNIHTWTEEFRVEAIAPSCYETEEEQLKVIRKPT